MRKEEFCEILGDISQRHIAEAGTEGRKRKMFPGKWGAAAACFAAAAMLGMGFLRFGALRDCTETAYLKDGGKIVFAKADRAGEARSLDLDVTVKPFAEEETGAIFGELPVTGSGIFRRGNSDGGEAGELIGFEGKIGNVKIIVSAPDVWLLDTVIDGTGETTEVNGVSIAAGYFVTDPNSRGEQNVIYYGTFDIGKCRVYLENAGTKEDREAARDELAEIIQKMTESQAPDLAAYDAICDRETGPDGDPEG